MLDLFGFRDVFPKFSDPTVWADSEVSFWLDIAGRMVPLERWGDLHSVGQGLYAAHMLILGDREREASSGGGGGATGVVASKSVGSVSVSYDTAIGLEADGGFWNTTTYGTRFYRMVLMVGMGGTQLGGPDVFNGRGFGPPWYGVIR